MYVTSDGVSAGAAKTTGIGIDGEYTHPRGLQHRQLEESLTVKYFTLISSEGYRTCTLSSIHIHNLDCTITVIFTP